MRGPDDRSEGLFSYVSCEARVPQGHPLRAIRAIVDEALETLPLPQRRRLQLQARPAAAVAAATRRWLRYIYGRCVEADAKHDK